MKVEFDICFENDNNNQVHRKNGNNSLNSSTTSRWISLCHRKHKCL